MQGWKEIKLKHVTNKIGSGATPTGGSNSYSMSGIAFVRSQNVLSLNFSENGLAYIDDEQATLLNNVAVENEDVFLNITGDSVARVCRVPKHILPARVNQHVSIIRSKPGSMESNFILYYLHSIKDYLLSLSEIGGTRRALTKAMLEDLPILLPPLPEQRAIASVLSSLDDKIDLLHRQNKTLEAMAETLFRQWFVEEAGESWEEVELGNVVETTSGGTPSRSKMEFYENGIINWVKSKELSGSFLLDTEEKITADALKDSSAKLLPRNSILIAMYGATVGEYAIISKEMCCNQAVCALKPNENYPYTFLFSYVKTYKNELINMAVGSAQQNISQQLIKQLPIPTCREKIRDFHLVTEPQFIKIKSNIRQIQNLEKLRDSLLPKLMSGEVRVKV